MSNRENEKQVHAYNRMMERMREVWEHAGSEALPTLQKSLEHVKQTAVELDELTREEAEHIAAWLKRDVEDAAHYLARTGEDLQAWLRFDIEQTESRLMELFARAADRTRLELLDFEESIEESIHYRTGEVTSPGTLRCEACGKVLHFRATGHIPPCPSCHGTVYVRPEPVDPEEER